MTSSMFSSGSELPVGLPGLITTSARVETPSSDALFSCASSTSTGMRQPSSSTSS